ncbi:hypothetical protein LCGC14_1804150, partial [marine sediment metagenome]
MTADPKTFLELVQGGCKECNIAGLDTVPTTVVGQTGQLGKFVTWGVDALGCSFSGHYFGHDVKGLRAALDDFEERTGVRDKEVSEKVQAFADKVLAAYHRGQDTKSKTWDHDE